MRTVILIMIACCLASCSLVSGRPAAGKVTAAADKGAAKRARLEAELQDVVDKAKPMIANLLTAINENNYEAFIQDCNASMKSAYHDQQLFRQQNEQRMGRYGRAGAHPILKAEKRSPFYNLYYLVKFAKLKEPVPVFLSLKKEEQQLKIAFVQFRFSEVEKR